MKKTIFISLALSSLFSTAFSQNDSINELEYENIIVPIDSSELNKKFKAGFSLGFNQSLLQTEPLPPGTIIENKIGFRVGVIGSYKVNDLFSIHSNLGISVNRNEFIFANTDTNEIILDYFPMPLTVDFSVHAKFTSQNTNYKPFFSIGPSIQIPVTNNNQSELVSNYNLCFDFAVGFEKSLEFFTFFPELRYSHGLVDINKNPNFGKIRMHTVSLILNFN